MDIWDKKINLTEEDRERLGINDEQLSKLQSKKEMSNQYLQQGEQIVTSLLNGLSQGYYDEYEGGATALGNGIANLGMQAGYSLGLTEQAPQEDVLSAMKRGYRNGRDYRRQVLEDAHREIPWISTGMETAGAVVSPANKILGPVGTGALSGYGNSNTNRLDEILMNMSIGAAGNLTGNAIIKNVPNSMWSPIARNIAREAISKGSQNSIQTLYNYNKEE